MRRAAAVIAAALTLAAGTLSDAHADDPPPVEGRVDADGWFVLADETLAGDVFAGPGVRCVAGASGRIESGAEDPRVWVRTEREVVSRPLRLARGDAPLFETFRRSATASAPAAFAPYCAATPERGNPSATTPAPKSAREIVPGGGPGSALSRFAPDDGIFVRFRSVEAALRFAGIADRIAARLLAARGDGRDRGTLRWMLHDLALPEIWAANPETEKGVGECAVVVFPRPGGGRLDGALLLRIRDDELHRMQTEAGRSWNALAEHVWAPADDPDPQSRARRGVRCVVGDVEVVATSASALERLGVGPRLDDDAAWRRTREVSGGDAPASEEAFVAFHSARTRNTAYAASAVEAAGRELVRRAALGAADLWRRWTGLDAAPRCDAVPPDVSAGALVHVVSVRATTGARGADVEVVCTGAEGAEAVAVALGPCALPSAGGGDACRANRRDLAPVALVERDAKDLAERAFVVLGARPVCPHGGTYLAHPITREVTCTVHGSDASPQPDPPPLPPLIRDLRREDATVRFRVPIAW